MLFRFSNPEYFNVILIAIGIAILAFIFMKKSNKNIKNAFGEKLSRFLIHSRSLSKRYWKLSLEVCVVILTVIAWARPQFGDSEIEVKNVGIELILAIDVSSSMLTEDVSPNRLEHAKQELHRLLSYLKGDKVGLVAFAGSAALVSPMTSDYSAIRIFLDSLTTHSISTQGTNFKSALEVAVTSLEQGGGELGDAEVTSKAIILASDGEETEVKVISYVDELSKKGIRVFTLGFGTLKGGPIPDKDSKGRLIGYKKNKAGGIVLSTAKSEALAAIARAGRGGYYQADFTGESVKSIVADIQKMEKTEFDVQMATDYDEKYQWPLFFAFLLGWIEFLLIERRRSRKFWKGRFVSCFLLVFFFMRVSEGKEAWTTIYENNKAVELLKEKKSYQAHEKLMDALVDSPLSSSLHYNLGHSFYQNKNFDEAMKEFESSEQMTNNKDIKFKSLFNAADSAVRKEDIDRALEYYQSALKLKPDSLEVKTNIELLMAKREQSRENKQDKKEGEGKGRGENESSEKKQEEGSSHEQRKKTDSKAQFKSKELTTKDVEKILEELKRQEEKVRGKFMEADQKKAGKEFIEKDW